MPYILCTDDLAHHGALCLQERGLRGYPTVWLVAPVCNANSTTGCCWMLRSNAAFCARLKPSCSTNSVPAQRLFLKLLMAHQILLEGKSKNRVPWSFRLTVYDTHDSRATEFED